MTVIWVQSALPGEVIPTYGALVLLDKLSYIEDVLYTPVCRGYLTSFASSILGGLRSHW